MLGDLRRANKLSPPFLFSVGMDSICWVSVILEYASTVTNYVKSLNISPFSTEQDTEIRGLLALLVSQT